MRLETSLVLALGVIASGCGIIDGDPRCPRNVAEALTTEFDDEVVGGGYVVRFVPSPDDPSFRGYDVNLTRPVSPRAELETYFLPVESQIPGITNGMPVLFIAERVDPHGPTSLRAGACPALTRTTEADVTPRLGD